MRVCFLTDDVDCASRSLNITQDVEQEQDPDSDSDQSLFDFGTGSLREPGVDTDSDVDEGARTGGTTGGVVTAHIDDAEAEGM